MFQQLSPDQFTEIADYGIAFVLAFTILVILPMAGVIGLAVWRTNAAASKRQADQLLFMTEKDERREKRDSERFDKMLDLFSERISPFGEIAKGLQRSLDAQQQGILDVQKVITATAEENRMFGDGVAKKSKEEIIHLLESMSKDLQELRQLHPRMKGQLDGLEKDLKEVKTILTETNGVKVE